MADSQKKSDKDTSRDKKKTSWLHDFVMGKRVNSDFIVKHWAKIFVFIGLLLIYIASKYQCKTEMEQIRQMSVELDIIKAQSIDERSRYMSRIRESAIQQIADSVHPGLTIQEQPPYKLKMSGDK